MSDRRFDEREVAEILRRATEPRTGSALARASSTAGLTLNEVKQIAAEAGIDVARVDEAASALVRPAPPSKLDAFLGCPSNVRHEFEVDGPLREEDLAELVRLIRATLDRQGVVGGPAGTLEWMDHDGFGTRNVVVTPTKTGTRVEISARFQEAAGGAAGITGVTGAVGATGTAIVIASSGPVGWVLAPVTLAAMYGIPRLTMGTTVRRESRRLASLADRIRDMLQTRDG